MTGIQQNTFTVLLEGGKEVEVLSDQRDWVEWELQSFYNDERYTTRMRFLAYSAMKRTDQYKKSWQSFNKDCLSVNPVKVAEVDPTNQDQATED